MKSKIIVTGSEGLIGKKVVKFLKKKNKVLCLDLKLGHNLEDPKQVKEIIKKNSNYNYIINLHGLNDHINGQLEKRKKNLEDIEIFNKYFRANVFSTYLTNINFIRYSRKPIGIINFASQYAVQSPKHFIYSAPKDIFYVASKFSVIGLTKYLATLHGKNININCIINSGIEADQPKKFKKNLIRHIPKARMMKVDDLFGIIEFLTSNKSSYMNGSSIVIDGGYSSW
jgi:NAD(P)-dependent dehydrogenase (short-subunit alcohol dehydrogenase family)